MQEHGYWAIDVRLAPSEVTTLVNPIEYMKVIFYARAYSPSKFMGRIGVYYTDGTSNVVQTAQAAVGSKNSWAERSLELDIDSSKSIDNFQFYLWRI